jgi:DNA end-binding protein Ku
MPRSDVDGSISFGLVNVPVKLFTAARNRDIRFNQLHAPDHSRIQMKRFCADEQIGSCPTKSSIGESAASTWSSRKKVDALAPPLTQGIEIEELVNLGHRPRVLRALLLPLPEKGGAKAYALLRDAMEQAADRARTVVPRQKQ